MFFCFSSGAPKLRLAFPKLGGCFWEAGRWLQKTWQSTASWLRFSPYVRQNRNSWSIWTFFRNVNLLSDSLELNCIWRAGREESQSTAEYRRENKAERIDSDGVRGELGRGAEVQMNFSLHSCWCWTCPPVWNSYLRLSPSSLSTQGCEDGSGPSDLILEQFSGFLSLASQVCQGSTQTYINPGTSAACQSQLCFSSRNLQTAEPGSWGNTGLTTRPHLRVPGQARNGNITAAEAVPYTDLFVWLSCLLGSAFWLSCCFWWALKREKDLEVWADFLPSWSAHSKKWKFSVL